MMDTPVPIPNTEVKHFQSLKYIFAFLSKKQPPENCCCLSDGCYVKSQNRFLKIRALSGVVSVHV